MPLTWTGAQKAWNPLPAGGGAGKLFLNLVTVTKSNRQKCQALAKIAPRFVPWRGARIQARTAKVFANSELTDTSVGFACIMNLICPFVKVK